MRSRTWTPYPFLLDTIRVEGRRRGLLRGRETMRERALRGRGIFLSGAQIAAASPASLTEYFGRLDDLMVRMTRSGRSSYVHSTKSGSCMEVFVNEWPVHRTAHRRLDDLRPRDIAGVEVFRSLHEAPDELVMELTLMRSPCRGMINIWTWTSW